MRRILSGNPLKIIKLLFFIAFTLVVVYLILFSSIGERLLTPEGRKELVAMIDRLVLSAGWFGPALFVIVFGMGVMALPATPFIGAGALIFGNYAGAVLNILGATLGASISFVFGRYFFREIAKGFLVGKLGELDRKAGRHGFPIVFYLRIVWFPFIVLNYAAGATRIRFTDYFWGTLLGTLPSIVFFSLFFGGLREIIANYKEPFDLLRFNILFPAILLGLSFFLPGIFKRIRKGKLLEDVPVDP